MNKLYRSVADHMVGGVCGGLAKYMGIDPLIVRIIAVVLAITNGIGLAVYLLLWVFVPAEDTAVTDQETVVRQNVAEIRDRAQTLGTEVRGTWGKQWNWATPGNRLMTAGAVLVGVGLLLLMQNLGLLSWIVRLWPVALVAIGVVILLNNLKEKP